MKTLVCRYCTDQCGKDAPYIQANAAMRRLIQQTQSGEAKPCCLRLRTGGSKKKEDRDPPLSQIPPDSGFLKAKIENAAYTAPVGGGTPLNTQDDCSFYSDESDSILAVIQLETNHSCNP